MKTILSKLAKEEQHRFSNQIILAKVSGVLREIKDIEVERKFTEEVSYFWH